MYKIKLFLLFFLFNLYNNEQIFNFTQSHLMGDSDSNSIFLGYGYDNIYTFTGTGFDKKISVFYSSTITFKSFTLISSGKLTPLIIDSDANVKLILEGTSTIIDSAENENDSIIFLKKGATLSIEGKGTLNIITNKLMAIKGDNSTSLILENATIKIFSSKPTAGGIYLKKDIIIKNGSFIYEAFSGKNPAIVSDNSIIINGGMLNIKSGSGAGIKANNSIIIYKCSLDLISEGNSIQTNSSIFILEGFFNIKSEGGKGIKAKKNIYIGEKDNNSNVHINIDTFKEGIEAKIMEIYSGNINIRSKGDGIKISSDICKEQTCSGEFNYYLDIYDGDIYINSDKNGIISEGDIYIVGGQLILFGSSEGDYQPITQNGLLKITGGILFAGGNKGKIVVNTKLISSSYNKHIKSGSTIEIYNNETYNLMVSVVTPKDIDFLYFNNPFNFTIKFNGQNEIPNVRNLINSENRKEFPHFNSRQEIYKNKYEKNKSILDNFENSKNEKNDKNNKENLKIRRGN